MHTLSYVTFGLVVTLAAGAFKAYSQPALPAESTQLLEVLRKQHSLPALAVVVTKDGKIRDRAADGNRLGNNKAHLCNNGMRLFKLCSPNHRKPCQEQNIFIPIKAMPSSAQWWKS